MRIALLLAFAAFTMGSQTVLAAELAPPVAECISANASKVEQAIPSLVEASTFLVDQVCAPEVTAEVIRQQTIQMQDMQTREKQDCEKRAADNPKESNGRDMCASIGSTNSFASLMLTGPLGALTAARKLPEASAFAAKTLLDLRLSHMKSGQPH